MENGNLNTDELKFLRTAARDSFYIHAFWVVWFALSLILCFNV